MSTYIDQYVTEMDQKQDNDNIMYYHQNNNWRQLEKGESVEREKRQGEK